MMELIHDENLMIVATCHWCEIAFSLSNGWFVKGARHLAFCELDCETRWEGDVGGLRAAEKIVNQQPTEDQ